MHKTNSLAQNNELKGLCNQSFYSTNCDLIMHYNCQGLNLTKISALNLFLSEANLNIKAISFNEHWLDHNSASLLNTINNFKLASSYIRESGCRGGSCILVDKNCKYVTITQFSNLNEDFIFECSAIELVDFNSILISIYTVPNFNISKQFLDRLEILFLIIQKKFKKKILFL